jgi:8-oxo-dGTP diphosphatase
MRTIHRQIVGAMVISSDDKVLLGLHDPDKGTSYAGYWVVPGGGIDEGETPKQAICREMMEEAGLDIAQYPIEQLDFVDRTDEREKTLHDGERVKAKMSFLEFRVRIDKPADQIPVIAGEEFKQLEWVPIDDIPKIKLPPLTQELFKLAGCWRG